MRVIIAGSRTLTEPGHVLCAIEESGFKITEVVCGLARGADILGERWAQWHRIPVTYFAADWHRFSKAAGPIRNGQMAAYAQALIIVHSKTSGSLDMIRQMRRQEKPIHEWCISAS